MRYESSLKTYISRHASIQYHANHATEEYDDNAGVDETEPMDLRVEYVEIIIISSGL